MRIFIIGSYDQNASEFIHFSEVCRKIGLKLSEKSIEVLLCSPFDGSADKEIILGLSSSKNLIATTELHYPQHENVESNWNKLLGSTFDHDGIEIRKFRHPSPEKDTREGWKNAWLFCQIQALNNASIILTIGGNIDGSSNLLLRIAEAQGKPIIPLPSFGGAAAAFLDRNKYELIDQLGTDQFKIIEQGTKFNKIANIVTGFTNLTKFEHLKKYQQNPIFFISYPRDRPSEADYIEMLLRRRNHIVLRDEKEFKPGTDIPNSIKENIYRANIFIAIWCKEYACSPWCFDELNLALERLEKNKIPIWIICVDNTRMVPPKARNLLHYKVLSREEIEGRILSLLEGNN